MLTCTDAQSEDIFHPPPANTRSCAFLGVRQHMPGQPPPLQTITHSKHKPLPMQIVAGAIAGKIREARKVVITAVGIDAVANMVLAVGNARIYLEENEIDIKVEPSFERQTKNGQELTVMRFDLIAEAI